MAECGDAARRRDRGNFDISVAETLLAQLDASRQHETLISLRGGLIANRPICRHAAVFFTSEPRAALPDVRAHVPGCRLRVERGVRDFVHMRDTIGLPRPACLDAGDVAFVKVRETIRDPVDMLLDRHEFMSTATTGCPAR